MCSRDVNVLGKIIAGFCHLCLKMLNCLNGLLYSADHHVEGVLPRTLMLSLKAMSEVDVLVVVYYIFYLYEYIMLSESHKDGTASDTIDPYAC